MNTPRENHRYVRCVRLAAGAALAAACGIVPACASDPRNGGDAAPDAPASDGALDAAADSARDGGGNAMDAPAPMDAPSAMDDARTADAPVGDAPARDGFAYRVVAGACRLLWQAHGSAEAPWLGRAVISVADLDGDGRRDVAVQGRTARDDGSAVIELRAGATGALIRRFELPRVQGRVYGVGDLDGDGVEEIAYQLAGETPPIVTDSGSVGMPPPPSERVVRAVSVRTGATVWERVGPAGESEFGAHPAAAPAVPGGGPHGNVLVGSYGATSPVTRAARVYLLSGADGATVRALAPPADGSEFFGTASMPGDLNGDGRVDFVVGDARAFGFSGALFALSGADGAALWTVRGIAGGSRSDLLGDVYAPAGDLDRDGVTEIAIGVHNHDGSSGAAAVGRVQVVGGNDGRNRWVREGRRPGEHFGAGIARAGDVNGDNVPDLVVGAAMPGLPVIFLGVAGRVAVLSGADGAVLFDVEGIVGPSDRSDEFGTSVDSLGDVTGDGRAEFVAGAPTARVTGAAGAGAVTAWTCGAPM